MAPGARMTVRTKRLRLRAPLRTAWGELAVRDILEVRLDWGGGDFGTGEAAPLAARDGVGAPAVLAALDAYAEVLRRLPSGRGHAEMLAACRAERDVAPALAAIDLALWDRAGRAAGRPVAVLIEPEAARGVPACAVIADSDPVFAAAEAYRAANAGFGSLKVKVGVGDDTTRVAAVRQAVGPSIAVRVEGGAAWEDAGEALATLDALREHGVELAEDVAVSPEVLGELHARSPVPVALERVDGGPELPAAEPGDVVCLRIARCGGITPLLAEAERAQRVGARVLVGSGFDGPVGVAAGLHAAAALAARGPMLASGLATLGMFADLAHVLPFDNGRVAVPTEPGLLGTTTSVK